MTTTTEPTYIDHIHTRARQIYDEIDRTRRLIESYLDDAERELGFLIDSHPTADALQEAEATHREMYERVNSVLGAVGGWRAHPDDHAMPSSDPDEPF